MIDAPSSCSSFESTLRFEGYYHNFQNQYLEKLTTTSLNNGSISPSSEKTYFLDGNPVVQAAVMDDNRLMDAPACFTLYDESTMNASISAPPDPLSPALSSPQTQPKSPQSLFTSYTHNVSLSNGAVITTDAANTVTTNTNMAAVGASSTATSTAAIDSSSAGQSNRKRRKKWLDHPLVKQSTSPMALKELRARRNRESAKRSRLRQKHYLDSLEAKYFVVLSENHSLKQLIEQLLPPLLDRSPLLKTKIQSLFWVPAGPVH